MNYKKIYTILLLLIVNLIEINGKFINPKILKTATFINKPKSIHEKRNVDGSSSCRPLIKSNNINNKSLNLYYHPISLFMSEARIPFKNCYYEFENSIIICNEITARYIYLLYLPMISTSDDFYGYKNGNSTVRCSLGGSKIKDWSFWVYNNGTFKETYDFKYKDPITEDNMNYFKIEFENDCVYSLPVIKKDYVKVSMPSECNSKYGSTIKNKKHKKS